MDKNNQTTSVKMDEGIINPIKDRKGQDIKEQEKVMDSEVKSIKMSKRRDLSLKEKHDLFKCYDALPKCSQRDAASKLGISQSTLCNLIRQRDKIDKEMLNNENGSRKRKRVGKCKDVETALLEWFKIAKLNNVRMSREILMEKAKKFGKMLEEDFVPTDGWLTRWKERNNVVYSKLHEDKKNSKREMAEEWTKKVLPEVVKNYKPCQIYNTTETALFYRALPEHTYLLKSESSSGCREIDERITVLLTCNQDGTMKKIPLVIGTSKNPKCFKGVKNLPLNYSNNKNAWMTSNIFTDYLLKWDKELKDEKIMLLLNNCAAHLNDTILKNIKLMFLPSNTTSILQPLDQGIIKSFKCHYRKAVVKKVVNDIDIDTASTSNEITDSISLLDSLHLINNAWEAVSKKTIKNCFEKFGFAQEDSSDVSSASEIDEDCDESFLEYVAIDENLQTTCEKMDKGIVDMIKERKEHESDKDSDEDNVRVPTAAETRKALQIVRRTLELKGGDDKSYQEYYALENSVEKLLTENAKQSWIENTFVKLL